MADNWFSLHVDGVREPVYVSEVVEKSMNPSFRFFDLNTYGAFVTRRDELVMKYWAKTEGMTGYSLLIELHVNLRSLHFIGKTVCPSLNISKPYLSTDSWKASTIHCPRTPYCFTWQTAYTRASRISHPTSLLRPSSPLQNHRSTSSPPRPSTP